MNEKEEYAKINNVSLDVIEYLTRNNRPLRCKCGRFNVFRKSIQSKVGYYITNRCDNPKCNPRYGIKRPEHSEFIKNLIKSGNNEKFNKTLIKRGDLFNKEINSFEFKKKILENKNIEIYDVEYQFSKMVSERNKNIENRKRDIINRYIRWEDSYKTLIEHICGCSPTMEWLDSKTDEELNKLWQKIHGVNTMRNFDRSTNTGRTDFYKSDTLINLKFNYDGLSSVRVRSGWESSLIKIFEFNKIKWSYETLKLKSLDGSSFYIPDFIAYIDNKTFLIEVKGSYFRTDKEHYIKNKLGAGIEYCKRRNWHFCLITKKPTTLNFTEKEILC